MTILFQVDFFWINRHQRSFEWFISLLNQIELEQEELTPSKRFITMRLYMTSAVAKKDMKAVELHTALDLIHQKRHRDMITGLMTKTEAGRPDWDQVRSRLNQPRAQYPFSLGEKGLTLIGNICWSNSHNDEMSYCPIVHLELSK